MEGFKLHRKVTPRNNWEVLIAERNPDLRDLMRFNLHLSGYHARTAEDPADLYHDLEVVIGLGYRPIVVLDELFSRQHSVMNGVVRHIRGREKTFGRRIPLIMTAEETRFFPDLQVDMVLLQPPLSMTDLVRVVDAARAPIKFREYAAGIARLTTISRWTPSEVSEGSVNLQAV